MADIFRAFIQQLIDSGFYNFFFPWLLAAAVFFALLKKSQVFGDSPALNLTIAGVIAFLVIGFVNVTTFAFTTPLSTFFAQGLTILLFVIFGIIGASLFYPNITEVFLKEFTRRTTLYIMLGFGIVLFVTSGLLTSFFAGLTTPPKPGEVRVPTDVLIIATGLIIFIIILLVAAGVARGGG